MALSFDKVDTAKQGLSGVLNKYLLELQEITIAFQILLVMPLPTLRIPFE